MRYRRVTAGGPGASWRAMQAARASACSLRSPARPSCREAIVVKPAPFTYHDPRTSDDLIGLMAKLDNAKLLAGGQSLMPMLNLRLVAPDHLIYLNRIPELAGIRISPGQIEIGAMTRQADLQASADLASVAPVFRQALAHVGHIQTRSRGTIGGSCCHLDPAAELPALCALFDAEFDVIGPDGARIVPASDWFCGYLQSALDARALLGRKLDQEAIAAAAEDVRGLDAMSDVHVSAAYRRRIAGVVTMRALADAGRTAEVSA